MKNYYRYPACVTVGCNEPTLVNGTCYDHAVMCPFCKDPSTGEMDHYNGAEWDCDWRPDANDPNYANYLDGVIDA